MAGRKKALTMLAKTEAIKSQRTPRPTLSGKKKITAARVREARPQRMSDQTMMVLREWESAKVPAKGPRSTEGMVETIMRVPMRVAESVACLIQNITAIVKAWLPSWETNCPCQRRMKLRLKSRVGVVMVSYSKTQEGMFQGGDKSPVDRFGITLR